MSRQSICILSFILLYHCFRTFRSRWFWFGLSVPRILLSHLSTQIRCAASDISIRYSLFLAASGFPSSVVKLARPHPSTAPSVMVRSSVYFRLHSSFVACQTTVVSVDRQLSMICWKVSVVSQSGHTALSSQSGMFVQKSPNLYIPCMCFHRKSLTFLEISLCRTLLQIASSVGVKSKAVFVVSRIRFSERSVDFLFMFCLFFRCL